MAPGRVLSDILQVALLDGRAIGGQGGLSVKLTFGALSRTSRPSAKANWGGDRFDFQFGDAADVEGLMCAAA